MALVSAGAAAASGAIALVSSVTDMVEELIGLLRVIADQNCERRQQSKQKNENEKLEIFDANCHTPLHT